MREPLQRRPTLRAASAGRSPPWPAPTSGPRVAAIPRTSAGASPGRDVGAGRAAAQTTTGPGVRPSPARTAPAVNRTPSIRQRLVRAFAAFGLVPVALLGLMVAVGDYIVRLRHGGEVLEAVGVAAAEELALFLTLHRGAVELTAERLASEIAADGTPDPARVADALLRTRAAFPRFLTMLATDADGRVVGGAPGRQATGVPYEWVGIDVSDRQYFNIPRQTGRPFLSGVFLGRGFGRDRLAAVSAPIVDDQGAFHGVVQGAIELASLERLMQVAASQPGVELLVVDSFKRVAFASPGLPFQPLDPVAETDWIDEGNDLPVRFVPLRLPDAPLFDTLVFERDTPEGWHVLVLTSRWHLLSRALVDLGLLALLVALVVMAALRAGRLQARRVTEPLRDLGRRLDTLSLAEKPALPDTRATETELATLEDAFARMAGRLGEAWERLRDEFATESMLREELAQSIAERRAMDSELSIAAGIQQSMVPCAQALSGVSAQLDVAAVLEPARAVGGDFYNVIAIDERYTCFFIGDVSDKGVAAALFMARVATLLDVVARRGEPPGRLLSTVAREIARSNPSEMFATVLCGVVDARVGTLSLASAGHDPPAVLRADGRIERPPLETGPALGFEADVEYPEWHLRLRPEDALVCWTDGLTEAPDAAGREFGVDGLDAVLLRGAGNARDMVSRLSTSALLHTGGAPAHDDLTLLVLRRLPVVAPTPARKPPVVLQMPNRIAVLPVLSAALEGALAEEGVVESVRKDIALVMEEVLTNTVRHGYPDGRRDTIRVEARREGERLHLLFDDGGSAWNPLEHDLPDVDADLDDREIGGLGILLVRELSESAQYQRIEGRNRLRLVIRLEAPEEVIA